MLKRQEHPAPLPEAATEEPRVLTPGEDADRATRRLKRQDEHPTEVLYPQTNDPDRDPGALSPSPDKRR